MLKNTIIAAIIAGAAVSTTSAAEVNGYLFANLGKSDADASRLGKDLDAVADLLAEDYGMTGTSSLDEKDSAFKIGAGLQLNSHVGIEFQYVDLGEVSYKAAGVDAFGDVGTLKASSSTDGLGINLVGTLPFNQLKLFGKIGYHKIESDVRVDIVTPDGLAGSGSDSVKEWASSFGVGASFAFTPTVALVAEYEQYRDVADDYDVDVASVGLRYNF